MVVGILTVEFHLPASTSLKAKRQVLQSVKKLLRNQLNVSVTETDYHDLWQRSVIGVSTVATDHTGAEHVLASAVDMIENRSELEVTAVTTEFV